MGTDFSAERSASARHLAETALVWLLDALKGHDIHLVVLGGLVPEVLTRGQEPPAPQHLGTTDVDIYLLKTLDKPEAYGFLSHFGPFAREDLL